MALELDLNLGGNFVEALEKSSKGLEDTEKHVHKAAKEFEAFDGELDKVRASAQALNFHGIEEGGHFLQFDLAEGAHIAFEAVEKVAEKVIELGEEMVKVAGDAEDLNLAIKLDVGEEGAEKVDELAEAFRGTRFSPKSIKESLLPILEESGDEESGQWADLVTAATDVKTRTKGRTSVAGALEALKDIELQPQKIRGPLKALGIKQKDFYNDLGDLLGISDAAAEKQVKAGKLKAQTLLSVALHQIAEREGGQLGNATNESGKTLGASLERLGNLKESIFERLAGGEGMKSIKGFLDNFITTLEGPIGTDLVNQIDSAFTGLFGDLSGPDGLERMKGVVGEIAGKVSEFLGDFRAAWPEIKSDFEAALPVFETFLHVLEGIAKAIAAIPNLGAKLGNATGQNLADLETGTIGRQETTTGGHLSLDYDERQAALKRAGKGGFLHHLFSRTDTLNKEAFAQIDDEKGAWEDVPQLAAGAIVTGPTHALIGEAGPEAVVPLGDLLDRSGGAGGGMSITFGDVIVPGGSAKDRAAWRAEMARLIGELQATYGAAA